MLIERGIGRVLGLLATQKQDLFDPRSVCTVELQRMASTRNKRHFFAVLSLESLCPDADPSRQVLVLATCLGHVSDSATYWYLQATSVLLRRIAEVDE